jgi:hypothetical protein
VAHALDSEDTDLGRDHCRKLSRVLKHFVVARHETGKPQLVDRDHQTPIIELWQPLIDSRQRNQIDLGNELTKTNEDRGAEVPKRGSVACLPTSEGPLPGLHLRTHVGR